jgi:hypothetical protein
VRRLRATRKAWRLEPRRDVAGLVAMLAEADAPSEAAVALGRLGAREACAPLLGAVARDTRARTRHAALESAITVCPDEAIGPALDAALADPDRELGHIAATHLRRRGRTGPLTPFERRLLDQLVEAAGGREPRIGVDESGELTVRFDPPNDDAAAIEVIVGPDTSHLVVGPDELWCEIFPYERVLRDVPRAVAAVVSGGLETWVGDVGEDEEGGRVQRAVLHFMPPGAESWTYRSNQITRHGVHTRYASYAA